MEESGGRYPTPHKGYQPPSQDYLTAQRFHLTTTTTTLAPPVSDQISYKTEKPVSMYSFSFTTTETSNEYYGQWSLD